MAGCCCTPLDGTVERAPDVDRVRRVAFAALLAGTAPRLRDLADRAGLDARRVGDIVGGLVAGGIATTEGDLASDPTMTGAEGLTIRLTAHDLDIGGRLLHTWCAFDTIGIPATVAVDAVARTTCPTCGAAIELALLNGQPPPSPVVGWWPLATTGPVNESFCPTANLFCSRAHLNARRTATATGPGEPLPLMAAAGARNAAMTNPFRGAPTSADGVDLAALVDHKDELVGRLRQTKYVDIAAAYGFEIRPGSAPSPMRPR